MATKHKCDVCGLYEWSTSPHTGALHRKIRANRERVRRGLGLRNFRHGFPKRRRRR